MQNATRAANKLDKINGGTCVSSFSLSRSPQSNYQHTREAEREKRKPVERANLDEVGWIQFRAEANCLLESTNALRVHVARWAVKIARGEGLEHSLAHAVTLTLTHTEEEKKKKSTSDSEFYFSREIENIK